MNKNIKIICNHVCIGIYIRCNEKKQIIYNNVIKFNKLESDKINEFRI